MSHSTLMQYLGDHDDINNNDDNDDNDDGNDNDVSLGRHPQNVPLHIDVIPDHDDIDDNDGGNDDNDYINITDSLCEINALLHVITCLRRLVGVDVDQVNLKIEW